MSKIEPTSSGDTKELNSVSEQHTVFPNEMKLVASIHTAYLGPFLPQNVFVLQRYKSYVCVPVSAKFKHYLMHVS